MILAFGVIVLGIIGVVGASIAAPLAVVFGGIARARGRRGLASGMLAWVLSTTAAIVVLMLGLGGNAGSGMTIHGADLEDLLALVPWLWGLTALVWLGFFIAARREARANPPAP